MKTLNEITTDLLKDHLNKYRNLTTGDIQSFVLGMKAIIESNDLRVLTKAIIKDLIGSIVVISRDNVKEVVTLRSINNNSYEVELVSGKIITVNKIETL